MQTRRPEAAPPKGDAEAPPPNSPPPARVEGFGLLVGVRIRGTLGEIDPLNKVPFKRARSRVQKCPL